VPVRSTAAALKLTAAALVAGALWPVAGWAADAHHENASGGLPQFDPTWFPSQVFWLAVTFVILLAYFSKVALPRLGSVLAQRDNVIRTDIAEAERCKREADKIRKDYEARIAKARDEADALFKGVDADIKVKSAAAQDEFRKRFDASMKETETRLRQATQAARADIETSAADLAHLAAEKVVGMQADPGQVRRVIENLSRQARAA